MSQSYPFNIGDLQAHFLDKEVNRESFIAYVDKLLARPNAILQQSKDNLAHYESQISFMYDQWGAFMSADEGTLRQQYEEGVEFLKAENERHEEFYVNVKSVTEQITEMAQALGKYVGNMSDYIYLPEQPEYPEPQSYDMWLAVNAHSFPNTIHQMEKLAEREKSTIYSVERYIEEYNNDREQFLDGVDFPEEREVQE